ncbi:hypothetical protein AVEN_165814-1 [Araneus ventricosus]|uniref:Uncharacterized protein n=1 Tax=Araneus ventricosus TaxID=182803 RepID=A0A4Y2EQK9_ARAVE|nr:hypothetical protein AVEN_165814-1 [Araneus ventricosus]
MIMIGSSVDHVRSGGMRNVPVTKAVEHLYATTAKFSGCVLLASRPAFSYPPRRLPLSTMAQRGLDRRAEETEEPSNSRLSDMAQRGQKRRAE